MYKTGRLTGNQAYPDSKRSIRMRCAKCSRAEQNRAEQSKADAAADLGRQFPDESCIHLQWQLPAEVELRAEGLSLKGGLKRRNRQLQLDIGREQGQADKGVWA